MESGYSSLGKRLGKAYGSDPKKRKKKLDEAKKKLDKKRSAKSLRKRLGLD